MVDEERLKQLRCMSNDELAKEFDMNPGNTYLLKRIIQPDCIGILNDSNLTSSQRQKKLLEMGVKAKMDSIRELQLFIDNKQVCERITLNKGATAEILKFLDNNPSTFPQIKENVKGFYKGAISLNKKIASIGPYRKRLYYLKEQENKIMPIIKLRLKEHEITKSETEELILEKLTKPMDYESLEKEVELSSSRLNYYTNKLIRKEKLKRISSFLIGKKHSGSIHGRSALLEKSYLYKVGQEKEMADIIIQKIPNEMDSRCKVSLTAYLKKKLPKPVFDIVHDSYTQKLLPKEFFETKSDFFKTDFIHIMSDITKDFGLNFKNWSEMEKSCKVLNEYGLLEKNAYEIKKHGGYDTIIWKSPKLKNKNFADSDTVVSKSSFGDRFSY